MNALSLKDNIMKLFVIALSFFLLMFSFQACNFSPNTTFEVLLRQQKETSDKVKADLDELKAAIEQEITSALKDYEAVNPGQAISGLVEAREAFEVSLTATDEKHSEINSFYNKTISWAQTLNIEQEARKTSETDLSEDQNEKLAELRSLHEELLSLHTTASEQAAKIREILANAQGGTEEEGTETVPPPEAEDTSSPTDERTCVYGSCP